MAKPVIPSKYIKGAFRLCTSELRAYPPTHKTKGVRTVLIPTQYYYLSEIQTTQWLLRKVEEVLFTPCTHRLLKELGWGVQEIIPYKVKKGMIQFLAVLELGKEFYATKD